MATQDRDLIRRRQKVVEELTQTREREKKLVTALAGLDALLELGNENQAPQSQATGVLSIEPLDSNSIKRLIVDQALAQPGEFTAPGIFRHMRKILPDRDLNPTTVSHALRRAAEEGRIAIVERGSGKRATRYKAPEGEGEENGAGTGKVPAP